MAKGRRLQNSAKFKVKIVIFSLKGWKVQNVPTLGTKSVIYSKILQIWDNLTRIKTLENNSVC